MRSTWVAEAHQGTAKQPHQEETESLMRLNIAQGFMTNTRMVRREKTQQENRTTQKKKMMCEQKLAIACLRDSPVNGNDIVIKM